MPKGTGSYQRLKDAGLCPQCGINPLPPDFWSCAECRQKLQERRDSRRAAGVCILCGSNPAKDGHARCDICLKRVRQRNKRLREEGICGRCKGNKIPSGERTCSACKEKSHNKYKKRITDGLCGGCGKENNNPQYALCSKCREYSLKYRVARRSKEKERVVHYTYSLKKQVFDHYGGAVCACCGEDTITLLCLDHVNNDGKEHRKKLGSHNACATYRDVIKRGYPDGFQVLCFNCNLGKSFHGVCPHKKNPYVGIV